MARIAYSYVRFSTPEQAGGDSLRRQIELAEKYARKHGLILDRELKLRDLGVSSFRGTNAATGALRTFLSAIEKKKVAPGSTLLVENLDRLSRDEMGNSIELLLGIIRSGVEVVTLCDERRFSRETINTDPMALMMSVMIFFRAHEESATKSRRVGAAWQAKRDEANTTKLTARCPAWLTLAVDRKSFNVLPDRAAIIRDIFRRTLAGEGKRAIVRTFNQAKLAVWGRGNGWHESYIQKILNSRAVVGEYQPHKMVSGKRQPDGDPVVNYFPAVISTATFNRTQSRLRRSVSGRIGRHVTNLFSGLIVDAFTGTKMRYVDKGTATRGKGRWRYLVSDSRRFGVQGSTIPYALFEKAFLTHVAHLDWKTVLDEAKPNEKIAELEDAIAQERTKLASVEKSLKRLTDSIEGGEKAAPKTILTRMRELETKQETHFVAIQDMTARLNDEQSALHNTTENAAAFSALAGEATSYETRLRLRDEIRRRIAVITLYGKYTGKTRHGQKSNPWPRFRIEFRNGVTRDVVLHDFTDPEAIFIHES